MNANVIERKFALLERLNEELDDLVWTAFHHYIESTNTKFNEPEDWLYCDGSIKVTGTDGGMGYYEPKSVLFSVNWVFDPEGCAAEIKESERLKQEAEDARIAAEREAEREAKKQEYKRLKSKFRRLKQEAEDARIAAEREANKRLDLEDELAKYKAFWDEY